MLRRREVDREARKGVTRWLVWLPLGVLMMLSLAAVVPLLVPVDLRIGPSLRIWVKGYSKPRVSSRPIGIEGPFHYFVQGGVSARMWLVHVAGPLQYTVIEFRQRKT
jgi:hypothetical protein